MSDGAADLDQTLSSAERAPGFAEILCAIGREEGLTAVEQAAKLAGAAGRVTLLVVTSYRLAGDRGAAIGPERAKEILDRAVTILEKAGVSYAVEVDPQAPPSNVILGWSTGRDLLAIGAPAASLLTGTFIKGVSEVALDAFTTPLLLARPASGKAFAEHIMVASDGLEDSDQIVDLAGQLARTHGAGLTLFHALGGKSHKHSERIDGQSERLRRGAPGVIDVKVHGGGGARAAIVDSAAEVGASLVVMGSRRLRGLRALGSVSRHVAHEGRCSVLLVPPREDRGRSGGGLFQHHHRE